MARFKTKSLFVPKNTEPSDWDNSRITEFTIPNSITREDLAKISYNKAEKSIDQYSLRNHWTLAGAETRVVSKNWSGIKELASKIEDIESVSHATNSKNNCNSFINITPQSNVNKNKIKSQIRSKIDSDLPLYERSELVFAQISKIWGYNYKPIEIKREFDS